MEKTPEKKSKSKTKSLNGVEEEKVVSVSKKRKADFPTEVKQENVKRRKIDDQSKLHGCDESSSLIASFDLDSTLIKTKSGKPYGISKNDWQIWDQKVIPKLKDLNEKGFRIVVFTNQRGVEEGHTSVEELKYKFENIQKLFQVPMTFLAATYGDKYRKPGTEMWTYFCKNLNGGQLIDIDLSFYCGDAAGRPKTESRPKDFSDSDRKYAVNIGLTFMTPELLFLGIKETLPKLEDNKAKLNQAKSMIKDSKPGEEVKIASDKQELVLLVGAPGCGKSSFWQNYFSKYERVNNDTLKTPEKCMKVCEEALKAGKSACVDNTNPTPEVRARYLDIAKRLKIPARCFYFDVPKDICMHNNTQRAVNTHRKHLSKKIAAVPIHSFFKNHVKPTLKEGFEEIKVVNFVPGPFENEEDEKAYYSLT